jgi:NADPH:quinone reductase-like Zn-dependent oxidoreductase
VPDAHGVVDAPPERRTHMLSLEFDREGDPLEVIVLRKDRPMPAIAGDEVLVRAMARPINAGEMLYVQGRYGVRAERFPAKLGIECMGVVVEIGDACRQAPGSGGPLREGQRVHCYVDIPKGGTWAEYVSVAAKSCTLLPDEIDDVDGSQVEVAPCTAMSMLDVLGTESGDWLLQTAASSQVAKIVIAICKGKGVRTINLVRGQHHVDELKSLGADEVLVTQEDGWQDRVKSLTHGQGVRHALDAVAGALGAEVATLLADEGRMLIYGLLASTVLPELDGRSLLFKQSGITGFWMQKWARSNETKLMRFLQESVRLTAARRLCFDSKTYDFETQWRDAIAHSVKGGRKGRPVLVSPGVRGGALVPPRDSGR